MVGFPYGGVVVAGTNATAAQENNDRKDGLTRWLKFEVLSTLAVANTQGGSFLMPFAGSVVQTYAVTDSGTATVRINDTTLATVIDSGIVASSTPAVDTSPALPNFNKNDILTMDITAISSGVHLIVMLEVLPTP